MGAGSDKTHGVNVEALTIDFTVYYAVQPPAQHASELPHLLLALHGWGQNCRRFLRDFKPLRKRNILVVAPQAPHQFYLDAPSKKVGFSWITAYDRPQAIADVNRYLERLLAVVQRQHHYHPGRVVLLGFSQGSSMAYRFGVSGLIQPAGVISCCSDLPADVAERLPARPPFPVLLAHGEQDTFVPRDKIDAAYSALSGAGCDCEEYTYPAGHELTPQLIEKLGDWIELRGREKPRVHAG